MPYDNNALTPLLANGDFTLWLYRTTDTRATALAAGYFAPAAARLGTGDLILLQAADSVALLPVRPNDVVAAGVVLDTSAAAFRVNRGAAQRFSVRQVASAVAMTVVLAPVAAGLVANGPVQASATVHGPVAQVAFSIRNAEGATVRGPQNAAVANGNASTTLQAPGAGSGYRLRVQATIDPAVADTSPPFAIAGTGSGGGQYALLLQSGGALLLEDGASRLML